MSASSLCVLFAPCKQQYWKRYIFNLTVMLTRLIRNVFLIFLLLSVYSQQPVNNKNLIGLNRARRPHNAIFVSFIDSSVPTKCLEAAKINWKRVCQKEHDRQAEEHLKKVWQTAKLQ